MVLRSIERDGYTKRPAQGSAIQISDIFGSIHTEGERTRHALQLFDDGREPSLGLRPACIRACESGSHAANARGPWRRPGRRTLPFLRGGSLFGFRADRFAASALKKREAAVLGFFQL